MKNGKKRYALLDSIRGITLLSMILYHGAWDLVYLYGVDWKWYYGSGAYIWQQSICWTFIFLSGFCWSFGKKHWKRGLLVFGGGLLVTLVTILVMPENRVVFGVLTMLGSGMLLLTLLDKWLQRLIPQAGLAGSLLLFVLTRNINSGFLGFEGFRLWQLPEAWYRGPVAAYLGFTPSGFYSTDYFSLIPWFFLFVSGYYLYQLLQKKNLFVLSVFQAEIKPFSFLGRHSLLIYLLHQPMLYLICILLF